MISSRRSGLTGASVVDHDRSVRRNGFPGRSGGEPKLVTLTTAWSHFIDVTAGQRCPNLPVSISQFMQSPHPTTTRCRSSIQSRGWSGPSPRPDVVRGYRLGLLASLQKVNSEGDAAGSDRVLIGSGSSLAGLSLNDAGLPVSIIVTTIQRKRDLVVPTGSTKLQAGDELMLIGRPSDIDAIRVIAAGVGGQRDDSAHADTKNIASKQQTTKK